ncbi:MAG: ABC transporter permease [Lachnospiraceae bacterium]|nr:ABC transporter permease [Lachnospiraceae bacterium]
MTRKRIWIAFALILVGVALCAGLIAPHDPYETNAALIRLAPCRAYPFGTDQLGRCVFSRVLYGARTTLSAAFFLIAISFVIGCMIGMLCGYFGGIADGILMRIANLFLALPQMVIAIVIAGILGGGLSGALIALGATMWVHFAYQARSHTYMIKQQAYITAARLSGKSSLYICLYHILPNLLLPLATNALTQIGSTIIAISGMSFLGIGVEVPKPEWGAMISEARAYLQLAPWCVLFPALAIILTVITFNELGDLLMEKEA